MNQESLARVRELRPHLGDELGLANRVAFRITSEIEVIHNFVNCDAAARNRGITHTPEFVRFGVEQAEVLQ